MIIFITKSDSLNVSVDSGISLIQVTDQGKGWKFELYAPSFELNGTLVGSEGWQLKSQGNCRELHNGGRELQFIYGAEQSASVILTLSLRIFPNSPFIRFRYALSCPQAVRMTKTDEKDRIAYTGLSANSTASITEIQFSQFDSIMHSFMPYFDRKTPAELEEGITFPGPIALLESDGCSALLAYEHGAEYPDSYLKFDVWQHSEATSVSIHARKGNYFDGQIIDADHPFESPWFHFAACAGDRQELFGHYRVFFLKYISECTESRKPYIFYNTWNNQERNRYYHNLPYLHSMNLEHTLAEIDTAAKLGVDVFVIDAGWFGKTGDWVASPERFPDCLKEVRKKLDSYNMKMGLWFNPIVAAETSRINREHPEYHINRNGRDSYWGKIWETEESWGMCLASGYTDYFIRKLVELNHELGVSYFKWDAINQYGCNSPHHNHGTESNTTQERLECYSYRMGMEMIRIVEEVSRQCPGIIVDFDITEGGRFVGLGFLSVGKYFLMNNGPYFSSFDIPTEHKREPDTINVFFHPGAVRARVCRQNIKFDCFLPSILFLTHFLPDGPSKAQRNSLASLVLGGNGIWGDLSVLNEQETALFQDTITKYKKVSDYATACPAKARGFIGSSPEIYEKLDRENAKGFVCFFTRSEGTFEYITDKINSTKLTGVDGADGYELTEAGRLRIMVRLEADDARIVFIY